MGWRGDFPPGELDSEIAVDRIGLRPILFVAVQGDRRMPPDIAQKLYARAQSPSKKLVILPGKRHGEGFNQAKEQYVQAVKDFLAQVEAK
jgi:fermentation-respiration switch protein FrsA (DUF1100 family)